MTQDPATIADGLTDAQKRALLKPHRNSPNWLARAPRPIVAALQARQLVDWDDNPARITPLGQAVRAVLESREG